MAVRMGKHGVWVETETAASMSPTERVKFFKEFYGLNPWEEPRDCGNEPRAHAR